MCSVGVAEAAEAALLPLLQTRIPAVVVVAVTTKQPSRHPRLARASRLPLETVAPAERLQVVTAASVATLYLPECLRLTVAAVVADVPPAITSRAVAAAVWRELEARERAVPLAGLPAGPEAQVEAEPEAL